MWATAEIMVTAENSDDAYEKALSEAEESVDFGGLEQNTEYEINYIKKLTTVSKMVKLGDIIEDESFEDESSVEHANNESKEFREENGQIVKPATPVDFDVGKNTYDVIVTFQAVVRVAADDAKDAITIAEEKIVMALEDEDIAYDNFQYAIKQ